MRKSANGRKLPNYRQAIKLSPKLGRAYRGVAWLMATCPEERFRNAELAVASARQALALDGNGDLLSRYPGSGSRERPASSKTPKAWKAVRLHPTRRERLR